jgi:crotonobetainyl-CoA:carnitine CoA-transferase CaiB-like acyl-CoA transferase
MKALEKFVIIDLTHMLSGPYATMLLSDMGAQTIKIEPPGKGEITRKALSENPEYSRSGLGPYFLTLNRNKRSICIDLKSSAGLEIFYGLVKTADIVFDNFSTGVTKRLKIDHDTLSKINERIITCSVTGFGETGPDPDRPAFDQVVQGMGGGMSITGFPGGPPLRSGIPIGDLSGGIFGALGVLAAVCARETTGRGQHVDVSMLDCQISLLNYMATMYLLSGKNPEPLGNGHFVHIPYDTFKTKTDWIIIAVIGDNFWKNILEVIEDPVLKNEKYLYQPGRFEDRDIINNVIQNTLLTNTAEYWLDKLKEKRIPCAPVNKFSKALSDPQILARNMVITVKNSEGDEVRMPGNPIKMSMSNNEEYTYPPQLGQHTDEILRERLGYKKEQIIALREKQVIG